GDAGDKRNADQRSRSTEIVRIAARGSLPECQITRRSPAKGRAVADLAPAVTRRAAAHRYGRAARNGTQSGIARTGAGADIEIGGGYGVCRLRCARRKNAKCDKGGFENKLHRNSPQLSRLRIERHQRSKVPIRVGSAKKLERKSAGKPALSVNIEVQDYRLQRAT